METYEHYLVQTLVVSTRGNRLVKQLSAGRNVLLGKVRRLRLWSSTLQKIQDWASNCGKMWCISLKWFEAAGVAQFSVVSVCSSSFFAYSSMMARRSGIHFATMNAVKQSKPVDFKRRYSPGVE